MGQTNADANGFSPGNVSLNMPCGNMAGDGPNRTRNTIPTDAPTQSTVNSAPILSSVNNPGVGIVAPNSGTPVTTTKNPDGSTATAHGKIAGTSIVFNSPA